MKSIQRVLSLTVVGLMLVFFAGCDQEDNAELETRTNQLEQNIQMQIDRLDERISELNNDLEEAGEEWKAEINEQIDNLEELRNDLSDELQRLRNATQDQLDQIEAEFNEMQRDVDDAIDVDIDVED